MMVKSMAQYLDITNKLKVQCIIMNYCTPFHIKASRKSRFPEDYLWNLQGLITTLHIRVQEYGDLSAKVSDVLYIV